MKKIFAVLFSLLLSSSVYAWTIGPMNYQGRLLDNAGIPVTGSYNFKVRIYDAISGGTLKFSEQHNTVAVDDGVYAFLVSTGTNPTGSWDIALWNTPQLYIEIEVNGETLTPRQLMAATPYAFQANLALTTNNALALGGKSAGNILQDICKSGKGKWLELANQCLGVGSSFPGPAMVNLDTLTASTNLRNLDLTNADISGINFGAADFTGTLFRNTTMNGGGVGSANMTDTVWDAVVVTGTKLFSNNFTGAKISNVNMAGWMMSATTLTNASIADLLGCPMTLPQIPLIPAEYRCRDTGTSPGQKYMILGPNMNFSETSLIKDRITPVFNPYGTLFNNGNSDLVPIPVNLAGVNFSGNSIEAPFYKVNLSGASFNRATITHAYFEQCDLTNVDFSQSNIIKSEFRSVQGVGAWASFLNAHLDSVFFGTGAAGSTISFGFNNAVLDGVEFGKWGDGALSLDFTNATLKNVNIAAVVNYLYAISTTVYGGLYLGPQVSGVSFENMRFMHGNLSGNWTNLADSYSNYTNVSFNGANLTGATGFDNNEYNNVDWFGATCPDGYQVTSLGGTCVGHFVP